MKTERRHELQKNDLADIVGTEIDYVKPYLKTIVGIIIAVAAVGFTIAFLSSQQSAKNAAAWGELYEVLGSPSPEDLEKFGDDHNRSQPGEWALLAAANMKLQIGSARMFDNRQEAEENLDQAKKLFQKVIDAAPSQAMIRQRAQIGLAKTFESLNDPESAIPLYEKLIKDSPNSPFGKSAAERLASLKRLNDEQWYAWFAEQKPAPAMDPRSGSPLDINNLPGRNDLNTPGSGLSLPNILEQGLKDLDKKEGDIKLPSDNATPGEKPVEPSLTPPANETPAEGDAEKKTAEPQPETTPPAEPKPEEPKTEEPKPEEPKAEEKKADEAPAPPADEQKPE